MLNFLSKDTRRNPYPAYAQLRATSPLFRDPTTGLRMIFDYQTVKRVLSDDDAFSSHHGPVEWLVFLDAPRHTQMRALISQAFTPRSIAGLESRIRALSAELLDAALRGSGEHQLDIAAEYSIRLPMRVIAELLGIPASDRDRFTRWSNVILDMSYTVGRRDETAQKTAMAFAAATAEMHLYLIEILDQRRADPRDDLLTRLLQARVDGEQLTTQNILGFFQLLLVAGQETTTNLINNALLCFMEFPGQLKLVRERPALLGGAIEETLRFRSPFQWMYRVARQEIILHDQTLRAGELVIAVMGSANRDPKQFADPDRFDVTRDPNPHVAFGHGPHFCLGAALARLEASIAIGDLLSRLSSFSPASDHPWEPRNALHIHGPAKLPLRVVVEPARAR